jgi:hypothetical protein
MKMSAVGMVAHCSGSPVRRYARYGKIRLTHVHFLNGIWILCLFLANLACARPLFLTVSPSFEVGAIKVQIPNEYKAKENFHDNVRSNFHEMEEDTYLRQIWLAAKNAPVSIIITPMTDNPETWNRDGSRTRSHADPLDNLPKRYGREKSTPAVIFINPNRIDPKHRTYGRGTLAHEFVHAIDLAYGRYHPDYKVRERRAVFVQNIWRDLQNYRLRKSYHGRFATLEYQSAKKNQTIQDNLDYIFTGNTFPGPE